MAFPYQTGIPLGYRDKWEPNAPVVGQVRPGNYGAAAGIVDIGNAYKALSEKHDYDGIVSNSFVNDANELNTKTKVEGDLLAQYAASDAAIDAAEYNYKQGMAGIEAGQSAQKQAGIMGTIGTVAKVALPLVLKAGLASDENVKNTIESIEDATAQLRKLHPVSFKYNEDTGYDPERKHHGFIAQQFQEVLPDATYKEHGIMSIDIMDVIGILVRGFQEIDTRIARLEATRSLAGVK